MLFRRFLCGRPDVVARQIDMLPAKRRQVGNEVIRNLLNHAQGGNRTVQIAGVPQDDGGDEEVEAGRAMLLVFVGTVADSAEPMKEDGPRQAVAWLALVELAAGIPAQL